METLKNQDVRNVLKQGRSFQTPHFIVLYKPGSAEKSRFAFVISRKFSKKAVERNRVKRIIREALRLYGKDRIPAGFDVVIIPKKNISGKKTYQLKEDITAISRVLKEENVEKSSC
ncbi:ribonuclease P protein component [Persephonella sp.]